MGAKKVELTQWKQLSIMIHVEEADEWIAFAAELGISRTEMLRRAIRALKEQKTGRYTKFNDWLQEQTDRNDPIGDLANDSKGNLPYTLYGWREYLRLRNACEGAYEALESAWQEWMSSMDDEKGNG